MNKELIELYNALESLRLPNGLNLAAAGPFYRQFCWLRDNVYQSLPYLKTSPEYYTQTMHVTLDWLLKVEKGHKKFYWLIESPHPKHQYRYLHARLLPHLEEVPGYWNNKQNDMFGEIFYAISLGEKAGLKIIRNNDDHIIIDKMIKVLQRIEYYHDTDHGVWEELPEEIHASSVGACVSGLKALKEIGFKMPNGLIERGEETLNNLLPRESALKEVDLALLTLVYPFGDVTTEKMKATIVNNIETKLLRKNGVIRYINDGYFNTFENGTQYGNEAEWTFGLAYLGIYYAERQNMHMAKFYLEKILRLVKNGMVPELYWSKSDNSNENTPLGWAVALTIILYEMILKECPDYLASKLEYLTLLTKKEC